ncbi:membrane protein [Actinomadura sp. NBRC 104425]|uniref:ferritin-like domain-containing protein n=1 Tax=Actinomadura sp. NBRC 104425 TaxID=3032204 RepID=UPI0024A4ED9B|nr:ferritin-like domain-containing protein [Actinomadura sp. NBRC 104425]GLZ13622.1 membrane protein [Actinomadura sp. NBRC 104425]
MTPMDGTRVRGAADPFARWREEFEREAQRRRRRPDPPWERGARLHPAVVRSVQRFQVGEDGDGANLIAKAGGGDYGAAVRLFVAEEREHARLLGALLRAAGAATICGHWSDTVFVRVRRAFGLRLELLVLMIAEVVALGYYRALRDGTTDPLTTEVAGRLLDDERRHVPFHCDRLRSALPRAGRTALIFGWQAAVAVTAAVVAADHGRALRVLGLTRRRFVRDVLAEAEQAAATLRRR